MKRRWGVYTDILFGSSESPSAGLELPAIAGGKLGRLFLWGNAMLLGPQISSISVVLRTLLLVCVLFHASVLLCSSTGCLGLMGSSGSVLLSGGLLVLVP